MQWICDGWMCYMIYVLYGIYVCMHAVDAMCRHCYVWRYAWNLVEWNGGRVEWTVWTKKCEKVSSLPQGKGCSGPLPLEPLPVGALRSLFRVGPRNGWTDRVMSHHDRIYITYRSHIWHHISISSTHLSGIYMQLLITSLIWFRNKSESVYYFEIRSFPQNTPKHNKLCNLN